MHTTSIHIYNKTLKKLMASSIIIIFKYTDAFVCFLNVLHVTTDIQIMLILWIMHMYTPVHRKKTKACTKSQHTWQPCSWCLWAGSCVIPGLHDERCAQGSPLIHHHCDSPADHLHDDSVCTKRIKHSTAHTHTAMQQVRHYQSINSATFIKI